MTGNQPTQDAEESTELPQRLVVSGGSDNLIEIYGDKRVEASASHSKEQYLAFNSGAILKIWYGKRGTWNTEVLCDGNGTVRHYNIGDYTGDGPVSQHSEVVTIENYQSWMAVDGVLVDFTKSPDGSRVYRPETGDFTPM
jgi:hypothetical protein